MVLPLQNGVEERAEISLTDPIKIFSINVPSHAGRWVGQVVKLVPVRNHTKEPTRENCVRLYCIVSLPLS